MLPNFLIIGAAKSGTTSLYRDLRAHPQVFMAKSKELKFSGLINAIVGSEPFLKRKSAEALTRN